MFYSNCLYDVIFRIEDGRMVRVEAVTPDGKDDAIELAFLAVFGKHKGNIEYRDCYCIDSEIPFADAKIVEYGYAL